LIQKGENLKDEKNKDIMFSMKFGCLRKTSIIKKYGYNTWK